MLAAMLFFLITCHHVSSAALSLPARRWRRRQDNVISWSAMEILMSRRQVDLYKQDADMTE